MNATVSNLCIYNNELIASGLFTTAGGLTSFRWARFGCDCYPNCDGSFSAPTLTANDFICFLTRYAAADPYADCDRSPTQPVTLTANDFVCFLNRYVAGCS